MFGVQSYYYEEKKLRTGHYYDYDLAALLMSDYTKKDNMKVLILGMGSGTYAKEIERYFENVDITGVEIDEKITALAKKYFNQSEDITVYTYDGRAFLAATTEKYDVIMVDAYQDITIPFQMSSIEFFTLVKEHLTDDGIMITNLNMRSDAKNNINFYLCDTISRVFSQNYYVNISASTNRELFSTNNPDFLEVFERNIEEVGDNELSLFLEVNVRRHLVKYEAGNLLLTDDKAPVENRTCYS